MGLRAVPGMTGAVYRGRPDLGASRRRNITMYVAARRSCAACARNGTPHVAGTLTGVSLSRTVLSPRGRGGARVRSGGVGLWVGGDTPFF
eukprot:7134364-Prymnesium_polylepis.1